MRVLFLGDVLGRGGRDAARAAIPMLRERLKLDALVVNVENAAHGFGVTPQICDEFYAAGADVLTTGNHVWDQREILPYIDRTPRLLRPVNYPAGAPGRGHVVHVLADGRKLLVANLMGRLFMDAIDDPFAAADKLCAAHRLGQDVQAAFIDFHAEATSEKMAFGKYLDGRVSCVVGTHTHVPSADTRILPQGTGYQTDAGMCGSFDGVIGFDADIAVGRFVRKLPGERLRPAEGEATLCGVYFETDDRSGRCVSISPLRTGGGLRETWPDVQGA